ncbi:SERTA domain-containing protein 2 [Pseudorasbora parva]|uniref:SERTA domain-containing protein 2 n=1 Tax=Pseudorasbora parva TaxID=51549 RepID=UPI00351F5523
MLCKGLKRRLERGAESGLIKMACPEEAPASCYGLQRQAVLNLSLLKLHRQPGHGQPDLARRVLITNTLRHIQDELRGEEGDLLPPSHSRQDHPSAPAVKDSFAAALAEIEALCPTVGITALFSTLAAEQDVPDITRGADLPDSGDSRPPDLAEMHSTDSDSAPPTFSHAPSCLADFSLDDFLFSEIDSFLFDSGLPLSATSGASRVVSMVTDDLVKTLAGYGSGGTSQSALSSSQTFSELDHIMEVLVGS